MHIVGTAWYVNSDGLSRRAYNAASSNYHLTSTLEKFNVTAVDYCSADEYQLKGEGRGNGIL